MSVSLLEVIEAGGYDPLHNLEDARWLVAQTSQFESLVTQAEDYIEEHEDDNSR